MLCDVFQVSSHRFGVLFYPKRIAVMVAQRCFFSLPKFCGNQVVWTWRTFPPMDTTGEVNLPKDKLEQTTISYGDQLLAINIATECAEYEVKCVQTKCLKFTDENNHHCNIRVHELAKLMKLASDFEIFSTGESSVIVESRPFASSGLNHTNLSKVNLI